jgi:tetratricopeptide (TPR) repeat protein
MGTGLAALEAGRVAAARTAFESAQRLRPGDPQVAEALARTSAAARGGAASELEQRAARLVAEERWTEALELYDEALARDSTLEFARRGRAQVLPRADLSRRLQALIERPERLAAAEVRAEADRLLARARAQAQGPVIRSQIARLELLVPEFDRPVRLALESDNATEVAIQRIGSFGAFDRREVELKPGQYTIIGKRDGFRDVRRVFTIAPGAALQTIAVRCVEPI